MRTRDARRIRAAIEHAKAVMAAYYYEDSFTRGFEYRAHQPKNRTEAIAYRATWSKYEYWRDGVPSTPQQIRRVAEAFR